MHTLHKRILGRAGWLALLLTLLAAPVRAQIAIPETYALPAGSGNAGQPGFAWNIFENAADQRTTIRKADEALNGLLRDASGGPLTNNAVASEAGGATGAGTRLGTGVGAPLQFAVNGSINFDVNQSSAGNLPDDAGVPGIPSATGNGQGIAAEALAWLELPVGVFTLVVNSDDGFRLTLGGAGPGDVSATVVGDFNGSRSASDSTMSIKITKAGLYAMRLAWFSGGNTASLEFAQGLPDGSRVAVNGVGSAIKAFRSVSGSVPTFVKNALPVPNGVDVPFDTALQLDLVGAAVDAGSVKLSLDGANVSATVKKSGDLTTATFQPPSRLAFGSLHSVVLNYSDGQARTFNWGFRVIEYAALTPDLKVTPDKTRRGFVWRVHENSALVANDNFRAERQLAGELGQNFADPDAVGAALGRGVPGSGTSLPIAFEIPRFINLNAAEGGTSGEFNPDEGMPGLPGLSASSEGLAAEVLTYIELPAGQHTLVVNGDDGFRATVGNTRDSFLAQVAGQYVGCCANDTIFRVVVDEAGVYPFRMTFYSGTGGANLEWKSVKADGTRVLLNDTDNGGFACYRATTGAALTALTQVQPGVGQARVPANANIVATIEEGSSPVDLGSVRLSLNGTAVSATATRNGTIVTVSHDPPADFPEGSTQTAILGFSAGAARTYTWSFTVVPPAEVPATGPTVVQGAGATFVAFEAESPSSLVAGAPENWTVQSDVSASGGSALSSAGTTSTGDSPHGFAQYRVDFRTTGTYYLYYRWRADPAFTGSDTGAANSAWVGKRFGAFSTPGSAAQADFVRTDSNNASAPANNAFAWRREVDSLTYAVASSGLQIFTVGTREAGMIFDRFVLSTVPDLTADGLDALANSATDLISQGSGQSFLAWEAEARVNLIAGSPETWVVKSDVTASGGSEITSSGTTSSGDSPHSFAQYRLRFATQGTYYLYYRWRADPAFTASDTAAGNSAWVGKRFGAFSTPGSAAQADFVRTDSNNQSAPASNTFNWRREVDSLTYAVGTGEIAAIQTFTAGTREAGMIFDRFVLSTDPALSSDALDALPNASGSGATSAPTVRIETIGAGSVRVTFTASLEAAASLAGPWTPVIGASSPQVLSVADSMRFFRARQ